MTNTEALIKHEEAMIGRPLAPDERAIVLRSPAGQACAFVDALDALLAVLRTTPPARFVYWLLDQLSERL